MAAKAICILGDWQHEQFAQAMAWLRDQAACVAFPDAKSLLTSSAVCSQAFDAAALLLVQSRPGQISNRDVERLHALAPLTRLVGLVGPWCEGELRSGRPWVGVSRIPWRSWQWRLPHELGLSDSQGATSARLPRTASDADRLQQSLRDLGGYARHGMLANVVTSRRTVFESLNDALTNFGFRTTWSQEQCTAEAQQADVVVFDGWDSIPANREPAPAPPAQHRLLVLHFPRPDDLARVVACGLTGVLPQPMLLADLAQALKGLLVPQATTARESAA